MGNLAYGRISYFSNMFCLFYFLGGYLKIRVILPIYSTSFFFSCVLLRTFLRGSFSVFASTPSPLLGVGVSGICTGGFP